MPSRVCIEIFLVSIFVSFSYYHYLVNKSCIYYLSVAQFLLTFNVQLSVKGKLTYFPACV